METILLLFNSISTLICIVIVSLSILGIYLLCATKPLNNSKIILINLSSSEIANSLIQITCNYLRHYYPDKDTFLVVQKLSASCNICYYAVYLITVDRLIATINPLRYRIFATKKRLTRLILATWTLALSLEISFFVSTAWFKLFDKHMWIAYDVFYVILCLVTYATIFFKIRSRRWFNNDKKFFKITSLIILSFIICIVIPNVIFHLYAYTNKVLFEFLFMMWLTGMMVDPIIYIFIQPELRSLLKSKFCRTRIEDAPAHEETAL